MRGFFYSTIISDEITLFIVTGALAAPFSVLHMMIIIRDCIRLQNLTPPVALHIPVGEKTKATPCLSFMFASFRCLHYSVESERCSIWEDRKEKVLKQHVCRYFRNLCL